MNACLPTTNETTIFFKSSAIVGTCTVLQFSKRTLACPPKHVARENYIWLESWDFRPLRSVRKINELKMPKHDLFTAIDMVALA